MKITYRVPTNEAFAFIEVEQETQMGPVPPIEIVDEYNSLRDAFKANGGISDKEYDEFIERYICEQPNHVETYNQMSDEQRKYVQIIKRAKARIKAKTNKQ